MFYWAHLMIQDWNELLRVDGNYWGLRWKNETRRILLGWKCGRYWEMTCVFSCEMLCNVLFIVSWECFIWFQLLRLRRVVFSSWSTTWSGILAVWSTNMGFSFKNTRKSPEAHWELKSFKSNQWRDGTSWQNSKGNYAVHHKFHQQTVRSSKSSIKTAQCQILFIFKNSNHTTSWFQFL
jgi:hypothetical protein